MADAGMQVVIKNDNTKQVLRATEEAIAKALELCGYQAERNAKKNLYAGHGVDTGLLRNSVTFALDGEETKISSYKADKGDGKGSYSGSMPKESGKGVRSVIIGTNVEYAPYVETGTSRSKAIPFLKPAVQDHEGEYVTIIKKELKNGS